MLSRISIILAFTFMFNFDKCMCQLKFNNNVEFSNNIKIDTNSDVEIEYNKEYANFNTNINPYPIVLLHGITSDKTELTSVANWLIEKLPNNVYNIEIGNGKMDSIFKTMDWQLNELCYQIYNIPELENGFHFIGMSQGGLLARGYVERCNKFPVINLITWVSPHAGVFGFDELYFNFNNVYKQFYQNLYSFSGYWKDPFNYEMYLSSASYLPYLNNERNITKTPIYYELLEHIYNSLEWVPDKNKANMLSLNNFVMIWSPNDDVLSPPESGKFEFYDIISLKNGYSLYDQLNLFDGFINGEPLPVKNLFESEQYTKDLIGLRTLYESNRLHILETNCTHTGHKTQECFPQLEKLTFKFLI